MYSTLGRADGLALARGEASASGDLLAALLWHAGLGSWLLHRLGVDRFALATRLAVAGFLRHLLASQSRSTSARGSVSTCRTSI